MVVCIVLRIFSCFQTVSVIHCIICIYVLYCVAGAGRRYSAERLSGDSRQTAVSTNNSLLMICVQAYASVVVYSCIINSVYTNYLLILLYGCLCTSGLISV